MCRRIGWNARPPIRGLCVFLFRSRGSVSRSRFASNCQRHRSSRIAKGESCRQVAFPYSVSTGESARRIRPMHRRLMPKRARPWFRFLRNGRIVEPCGRHPNFHSPSFARYELAVGLQPCSASTYESAGMIHLVDSASRRYETRGRIFLYRIDLSAYEGQEWGSGVTHDILTQTSRLIIPILQINRRFLKHPRSVSRENLFSRPFLF